MPRVENTRISYHHAGLSVCDEPVPWNAESVQVEALVQRLGPESWRKEDFSLAAPGALPAVPESLQPEGPETFRLSFRFPPPEGSPLELRGHGRFLGELDVPVLSAEEFVRNLRMEAAGVRARLGEHLVPCRAMVASQCRGLLACGLLRSPTSLLPLLDLDLRVEFTDLGSGRCQRLPLSLTRSQLTGTEALLSAAPRGWPAPGEVWSVCWLVAGRCLAEGTIRALSRQDFCQSLGLVDARYACERVDGIRAFTPYLPAREGLCQVGPCFRLASREPGAAGFCPLELHTVFKDPGRLPEVFRQEVLVTDAPSPFLPPLLSAEEFEQVATLELLCEGRPLGALPGCRPVVRFTSEGGFMEPAAYDWTPVAEQELADRLERLEGIPEPGVIADAFPVL
jgi:hypothetical protein